MLGFFDKVINALKYLKQKLKKIVKIRNFADLGDVYLSNLFLIIKNKSQSL